MLVWKSNLRISREELTLTHVAAHVGTEDNELADRMAMLGAQRKEKNCVCIGEK